MAVHRPWPRPPADGTIHLVGDSHFGSVFMHEARKESWAQDLADPAGMQPDVDVHVLVGDVTDNGIPAEDAEAIGYLDQHLGAGRWVAAVGNHDIYTRTPDQSATAWGMPAANYVHDLGFARLLVVAPDGLASNQTGMQPFTSTRLNWMNAQLQAAGDTPCLIVCHWSLYDTVTGGDRGWDSSITPGYWAENDNDVRALLADNRNAHAWLSGHTHSPIDSPGLVSAVRLGGRDVAAINASSVAYTGDGSETEGRELHSMYVTVTDGRVEVRFRDHAAGRWRTAGPDHRSVWAVNT